MSTPSLPSPSTKLESIQVNPIIEEDRQRRLWSFIKIFREVILIRNNNK